MKKYFGNILFFGENPGTAIKTGYLGYLTLLHVHYEIHDKARKNNKAHSIQSFINFKNLESTDLQIKIKEKNNWNFGAFFSFLDSTFRKVYFSLDIKV